MGDRRGPQRAGAGHRPQRGAGGGQRAPPREIRIDIRAIEFLHSGCLKYLVNWITPLQNQAGEIYKISLIWNPGMNWQKRTIYVLCSLAPDVLTAITVDEPIRPRPPLPEPGRRPPPSLSAAQARRPRRGSENRSVVRA